MAIGLLGLWIAGPVAVGWLGLWPWIAASVAVDCCANFRRIAGPVAVGLLESRNGKWIWLKHYQAAKDIADIANQIEIFIATKDVKIATKHCNR